jgi:hypothetical protein
MVGYGYLTAGLLVKYHRLALALLGATAVSMIVVGAWAIFHFRTEVVHFAVSWEYYAGFSIPIMMMLLGLWYLFDPAMVRLKDFRKEIEQ